jgi:hypothetical protein
LQQGEIIPFISFIIKRFVKKYYIFIKIQTLFGGYHLIFPNSARKIEKINH